jgi:hypothetical protein
VQGSHGQLEIPIAEEGPVKQTQAGCGQEQAEPMTADEQPHALFSHFLCPVGDGRILSSKAKKSPSFEPRGGYLRLATSRLLRIVFI